MKSVREEFPGVRFIIRCRWCVNERGKKFEALNVPWVSFCSEHPYSFYVAWLELKSNLLLVKTVHFTISEQLVRLSLHTWDNTIAPDGHTPAWVLSVESWHLFFENKLNKTWLNIIKAISDFSRKWFIHKSKSPHQAVRVLIFGMWPIGQVKGWSSLSTIHKYFAKSVLVSRASLSCKRSDTSWRILLG